jgi:hypothetical protein
MDGDVIAASGQGIGDMPAHTLFPAAGHQSHTLQCHWQAHEPPRVFRAYCSSGLVTLGIATPKAVAKAI